MSTNDIPFLRSCTMHLDDAVRRGDVDVAVEMGKRVVRLAGIPEDKVGKYTIIQLIKSVERVTRK